MAPLPCVISVADHAGWAYAVCVSVSGGAPVVVSRRRLTLIEPGLPTLPYHHDTLAMRVDEANALIARVRRSIATCTSRALHAVVEELSPAHAIVGFAIREAPFGALPASVVTVRQSYRLQCAADGMMYQLALCDAARALGIDVHLCRRGDEAARAATRMSVRREDVEAFVDGAGRPAGPPWTQEHRRAYAAGLAVLASHTPRLRLPSTARATR